MHRLFRKSLRDYVGGALMVLLGLAAILEGRTYQVGSVSHMGPGFFPVWLGAILACSGLAIIVYAKLFIPRDEDEDMLPPEWRAWMLIIASVAAFVGLATYGGLVPATFAVVFLSALADRDNTVLTAAVLAAAITLVCVVVFWWALQLQIPLFRWG